MSGKFVFYQIEDSGIEPDVVCPADFLSIAVGAEKIRGRVGACRSQLSIITTG